MVNRKMKLRRYVFLLFSAASFGVDASSYQGKVSNVFAYEGSIYIALNNGYYDSEHTCGDGRAVFRIDQRTSYGKSPLAMALAAKTAQGLVWAAGDDSCIPGGPYGKFEMLTAVDLKW